MGRDPRGATFVAGAAMSFNWTAFWLICICGAAFAWDWKIKDRVVGWLAPRIERLLFRMGK